MDPDRSQRWGLAAALGAALAASACCTLPFLLAAVGVGGAFASSFSVLEPYRGVFVALAIVALGFAFWRSSKAAAISSSGGPGEGGPDCECDTPQRSWSRWAVLASATVVTAVLLAAPALLSMSAAQPSESTVQHVSLASEREAVVRIEGMTCDACARGVEATLGRTEGVVSAAVTMEPPEARIRFDEEVTTPEALAEVIASLGYETEIVSR
jgi:copper chaperone CopZ